MTYIRIPPQTILCICMSVFMFMCSHMHMYKFKPPLNLV